MVIHEIATAAGYRGMIEGQMKDIASEGKMLNKSDDDKSNPLRAIAKYVIERKR